MSNNLIIKSFAPSILCLIILIIHGYYAIVGDVSLLGVISGALCFIGFIICLTLNIAFCLDEVKS